MPLPPAQPSSHPPVQFGWNFSSLPYILIIQSPGFFSASPPSLSTLSDLSPPVLSSFRSASCPKADLSHTHGLCALKAKLPHSLGT